MTTIKPNIGSGTVIVSAIIVTFLSLLIFGNWIGWDLTWRSFGVTPLHPYFFDTHAVTDQVVCAQKGFDPYHPNSCSSRMFNYPPIWLWLGYFGIDGTDSSWIAVLITVAALAVLVALTKGRSVWDGMVTSFAILSPSMMMGIERGNVDLFILALVGGAALLVAERRPIRMVFAAALIGLAIVLKLYPIFCAALTARFSRSTFFFAVAIAMLSLVYFAAIFAYLPIIKHNTPSIYLLSYGYKVPFLGLDRLLAEAKLDPSDLANTGFRPR